MIDIKTAMARLYSEGALAKYEVNEIVDKVIQVRMNKRSGQSVINTTNICKKLYSEVEPSVWRQDYDNGDHEKYFKYQRSTKNASTDYSGQTRFSSNLS